MTIGTKLPSACQQTAKACKSTKFENKNNMTAACGAAVVSLIEELLADNSVLEEASSCEDDEFLFFLLIDSKEIEKALSVLIITSNALYHSTVFQIFEVIFRLQELQSAV